MQPSTVVILGSTGSIGTQGLDVISRHLDRFTVTGLAAGGAHVELLAQQAAKFHVPTVAIFYKEAVPALREALEQVGAGNVNITAGPDAVIAMAGSGADVVLNGITGSIGLEPSIAALQAGSQLALANKESVVAGGHLLFSAQVRDKQINPVDSEHSAIWQSLRSGTHGEVSKLVVTASGGPFRGWKRDQMTDITPEQALNHPTWNMGPVVTINSSTLMNKGLEVIEASRLFDVPHRRDRASAIHRAFHGGIPRRRHHRAGFAAGHAPADRPRPVRAGTSRKRRRRMRLDEGGHVDVRAARQRGVPRGEPGPALPRIVRKAYGRAQRGQRGRRSGLFGRKDPLHGHRPHQRADALENASRTVLDARTVPRNGRCGTRDGALADLTNEKTKHRWIS